MDTKKLKREFGQDIVFWGGGVDTQQVLPFGTADQVRDEVKRRIDDLAPGGGFVFAAIHNVQAFVPPENIVGEPEGRDTANAIALAAEILGAKDPDGTMAVFTADQVIRPVDTFAQAVQAACEAAERHPEALVHGKKGGGG